MATPGHAALAAAPSEPRVSSCRIEDAAPELRRLPLATILAPLDIGPKLLYATEHRVVATSHHRAAAAMHDVIAAFLASPDQARALARKHGASYVAMCPGLFEARNYAAAAPAGLAAQLAAGRAPAWLRPLALPGESGLKVWKVVG
jgi:hypothetical protein